MVADDDWPPLSVASIAARRHSEEGSYSHHGDVLRRPSGKGDLSADVTTHELSHFWLTASTPYGLFLHELSDLQAHHGLMYCRAARLMGSPVVVPSYRAASMLRRGDSSWITEHQLDGAFYESAFKRFVRVWADATFIEDVFEGGLMAGQQPVPSALSALHRSEREVRAIRSDSDVFDTSDMPEPVSDYQLNLLKVWHDLMLEEGMNDAACPSAIAEGVTIPLGASHLFEGLATQMEAWAARDPELPRRKANTEYFLLWFLFFTKLDIGKGSSPSRSEWFQMLLVFAAIGELALFTPVGQLYARLRNDQMTWLDIHPGFRFFRILDVLEHLEWPRSAQHIATFQSAISRMLGWPDPERFLRLGATIVGSSPVYARHAEACRLRLDRPSRLVMAPDDFDFQALTQLLIDFGPMQVIDGRRTIVPGNSIERKLTYVVDYFVSDLVHEVMMGGSPSLLRSVPPGISDGELFENITSERALVDIIVEALPYLERMNIVSIRT
jgi:hypothetical protein